MSKVIDAGASAQTGSLAWAQREKWPVVVTVGLVTLVYLASFRQLISDWLTDANYAHGFFVPIGFVWLLWQRRGRLASAEIAPRTWGLALVLLGALQLALGTLGAEHFVAESSLLVMLSGVTIYLAGLQVFRILAFPIAWLLFMIPLPATIFYALVIPLQLLVSRLASGIFDLLGVPNVCEGNVIHLLNYSMGVAEACSGIRSLISLLALAVFAGHVVSTSNLARWIAALSVLPIAVGMNVLRVVAAGLIGNYVDPRRAEGLAHTALGSLLFFGAMALLVAELLILRRMVPARSQ
jgi:exosortase